MRNNDIHENKTDFDRKKKTEARGFWMLYARIKI